MVLLWPTYDLKPRVFGGRCAINMGRLGCHGQVCRQNTDGCTGKKLRLCSPSFGSAMLTTKQI